MTPNSDNPSPTPQNEPINAAIDATVKEAVQESSGPEDRETPRSSSLVNNGQSSPASRCYAAPDSSDDPLRTSTILPITPPFPSNSCARLASARGNRCAMSGLIFFC